MKIRLTRIPAEGLIIEESLSPKDLDLGTDVLRVDGLIKVRAQIIRITNAVTAKVSVGAKVLESCSLCLEEFALDFHKDFQFNYSVTASDFEIDLSQEIREEIILEHPMKPLCRLDCKGLCAKCGKNLNQEACSCCLS